MLRSVTWGICVLFVPGGGVALIRARTAIASVKGANADQDAGIKIVLRAMEEPLRQIVTNGGEEASVVVACALANKLARIAWAILARGTHYQGEQAVAAA